VEIVREFSRSANQTFSTESTRSRHWYRVLNDQVFMRWNPPAVVPWAARQNGGWYGTPWLRLKVSRRERLEVHSHGSTPNTENLTPMQNCTELQSRMRLVQRWCCT